MGARRDFRGLFLVLVACLSLKRGGCTLPPPISDATRPGRELLQSDARVAETDPVAGAAKSVCQGGEADAAAQAAAQYVSSKWTQTEARALATEYDIGECATAVARAEYDWSHSALNATATVYSASCACTYVDSYLDKLDLEETDKLLLTKEANETVCNDPQKDKEVATAEAVALITKADLASAAYEFLAPVFEALQRCYADKLRRRKDYIKDLRKVALDAVSSVCQGGGTASALQGVADYVANDTRSESLAVAEETHLGECAEARATVTYSPGADANAEVATALGNASCWCSLANTSLVVEKLNTLEVTASDYKVACSDPATDTRNATAIALARLSPETIAANVSKVLAPAFDGLQQCYNTRQWASPYDTISSLSNAASAADGSGSGTSMAVVAGAVAGAVAGCAVLTLLGMWIFRRRKRQNHPKLPLVGGKPGGSTELMTTDPFLASVMAKLASTDSGVRSNGTTGTTGTTGSSGTSRSLASEQRSEKWIIPFEELKLTKLIGEGAFGKVYLGNLYETPIACKLLLGAAASLVGGDNAAAAALSLSSPILNNLQQEAALMASLRHPNVLGFMGLCTFPACLISEYCPRGSLYDVLRGAKETPQLAKQLTWSRRLQMATGAAQGMWYLHSRKPALMHRDLKSPNLLVDRDWRVKVADFNLSRIMDPGLVESSLGKAAMNPRWLAPEVMQGGHATLASDVYAFSIVLWEMLTWQLPWADVANPWQIARAVMGGERLEVPPWEQLPGLGGGQPQGLDAYLALMRACWAQEPEERPSFQAVITELRRLSALAPKRGGKEPARGTKGAEQGGEEQGEPGAGIPMQDSRRPT